MRAAKDRRSIDFLRDVPGVEEVEEPASPAGLLGDGPTEEVDKVLGASELLVCTALEDIALDSDGLKLGLVVAKLLNETPELDVTATDGLLEALVARLGLDDAAELASGAEVLGLLVTRLDEPVEVALLNGAVEEMPSEELDGAALDRDEVLSALNMLDDVPATLLEALDGVAAALLELVEASRVELLVPIAGVLDADSDAEGLILLTPAELLDVSMNDEVERLDEPGNGDEEADGVLSGPEALDE